jgi:DNA repair photolyase
VNKLSSAISPAFFRQMQLGESRAGLTLTLRLCPSRSHLIYCPHGCWYCYANYDKETAIKNFQQHDPNSDFLLNRKIKVIKELTEDDKEKETQLGLF